MQAGIKSSGRTRAEQETETAAERLGKQIEAALASVSSGSGRDADELDTHADRIERAARDLATALRELALERQNGDTT